MKTEPPIIVFEEGRYAYVYHSIEEAACSIEAIDVREGFYTGAFRANGEVLELHPRELRVDLVPTSIYRIEDLFNALLEVVGPEAARDPGAWAAIQLNE